MTTRVEIGFNSLYGFDSQADASITSDDEQTFVDWDDVIIGNFSGPYATYEQDFWLLDGNYHFMPAADIRSGFISESMTDENGESTTYPTITIQFTEDHITSGLNFVFGDASDDYPTTLVVTFYNSSDAIIQDNTYNPSDPTFSTGQAVVNFRKIVVQMQDTSKPYRYQRLQYIEFDTISKFGSSGEDPIKSCSITEETNPLSIELPIDTLAFTVMPINPAAFNIISPSGIYADIKNKMPLYVRAFIGNDSVFMGKYYLDEYKNGSNTEIDFTATDAFGILDSIYRGWFKVTNGVGTWNTVAEVVDDILDGTGIDYTIEGTLGSIILLGYIPRVTRREALQKVLLAAHAYATCSRGTVLQIRETVLPSQSSDIDYTITDDEQSITSLELKPQVTAVDYEIEIYYETAEALRDIYEADFAAGSFEVIFNEPFFNIGVTGATLDYPTGAEVDGTFTVQFTVSSPGTVTIEGVPMFSSKDSASVVNGSLPATAKQNRVSIHNTIIENTGGGAYDAEAQAQYIYDYYLQRYLHKARLFQPIAEVGKLTVIDTLHSNQIDGTIEKMSIDLTGGFIANAEITGVVV
jgi:hypothetical protein